ncbi:MAG TPA: hypothetical protein VKB87_24440 [Myxococcaceae bacterium]|nr:hypothetical protein [Myxococcaceae bacterium]
MAVKSKRWAWRFSIGVCAAAIVGAGPAVSNLYKQVRAEQRAELVQQELRRRLHHSDDSPVAGVPGDEEILGSEQDEELPLRELANLAYFGLQDAEAIDRLLQAANAEARRWPDRMPDPLGRRALNPPTAVAAEGSGQAARPSSGQAAAPLDSVSGHSWINLGPANANFQFNGGRYPANDSGRVADIAVDPRDSDIVYVAASAGGLWKTYNFFSAADEKPTWHPVFDAVGNVSIGAVALDRSNPDTVYAALGDPFDLTGGGRVAKSIDGGGTWTIGPQLVGAYPSGAGGRTEFAVSSRSIAVDPTNSNVLLVATEVGLFRSTDGGSAFALASLPTASDGQVGLESAAWSIAYLGSSGGSSRWLVSGVYACAPAMPPPRRGLAGGTIPGASCAGGNPGDIWRSIDSGATWLSLRQANALPDGIPNSGIGRVALAAGDTSNPNATVVYAMASSMNEGGTANQTVAILKSADGGASFQLLATNMTPVSNSVSGCTTMNVGHNQSWYNLAVAVSAANPDQVIFGGNLCGVRSLRGGISADGNSSWDNIAHWLPGPSSVQLPYVHADWHALTTVQRDGNTWVLAGSDGGIFASGNVFQAAPSDVVWSYRRNRGLTTHQFYSIASGDPAMGNPYIAFGGLQDNGTRFRETDLDSASRPQPTTFNQVVGGDGVASVVAYAGGGDSSVQVYWGALPGGPRTYCRPSEMNCNQGGAAWRGVTFSPPSGDSQPFFIKYAVLDGDPEGALLTATNFNVFQITSSATGTPAAARITDGTPGPFPSGLGIRNIWAAAKIYGDPSGSFRLYGVALGGGRVATGVDSMDGALPVWTTSPTALGVGPALEQKVAFTTGVAFPSAASNFQQGMRDRDALVFLVGSTANRMADELTLVPDSIGHLFLTLDGGNTWRPFGASGANRLPNVPVQVVKFDPADATDQTIYVGTDIGVYRTTDRGANWERFGVGFPFGRVTDLFIAKNGGLLRAATYGRGVWEIYPNAAAPTGVKGDGDYDRNQQIDFRDLAALASRLGTNPSTSGQPFYDWRSDLVGDSSSIDESDLTALLAAFGGHP